MTIAAVVCSRDRPELLERCLTTLAPAVGSVPGAELIVVEQGDRPVAERIGAELAVRPTVIVDTGRGVSRARNIGWRAAGAPVVAFTDDDCLVPPTWLADHLAALDADGAADAVAACGPVTGLPRHGGRSSEVHDPIAQARRHGRGALPWEVGHASNLAVRVAALEAVGGFDERLGPGAPGVAAGEDADLIARLLEIGDVLGGVGAAVAHVEWRREAEVADVLRAYERGAGAWIGAQARRHPRDAAHSLRWRLRLQRTSAPGDASLRRSLVLSLTGGVIRGLRLGPRATH